MAVDFLNEKQRYYVTLCRELQANVECNSPDVAAMTDACEHAWRDMNLLEQQQADSHIEWLLANRPAPHLRIKHNG